MSSATSVRVVALAVAVLAALGILAVVGVNSMSTSNSTTRANGCVDAYYRMAPGVARVKFLLRCTSGSQPSSNLA